MKKTTSLLLLLSAALSLTACGGGGGETATTPPPVSVVPLTADITTKPSTLSENSTAPIQVSINNAQNTPVINFTSDVAAVTVSANSGTYSFTLNAGEVDRATTARVTMTVTDGNDNSRKVTRSFDISIDNTSFADELVFITALTAQRARLVDATEEKRILSALSDITSLAGNTTASALSQVSSTNSADTLDQAIANIPLESYLNGTQGDAALLAAKETAMQALERHIAPYRTEINAYFSATSSLFNNTVTIANFTIVPELNTASFLIGNPAFGEIREGKWIFNDAFSFLPGILDTGCGQ